MKDDDILTFIIGYIGADRLKELWMKKAEQNGGGGRGFVVAFVADMDKRGVSFTAGETVEVQMQHRSSTPASRTSPSRASSR